MTSSFHELGVSKEDPNVLSFYFTYTFRGAGFRISVYDKYRNGDPPESVFNIPQLCPRSGLEDRTNESDQIPPRPMLAESFTAEVGYYVLSIFCITLPQYRSCMSDPHSISTKRL